MHPSAFPSFTSSYVFSLFLGALRSLLVLKHLMFSGPCFFNVNLIMGFHTIYSKRFKLHLKTVRPCEKATARVSFFSLVNGYTESELTYNELPIFN